MADRRSLRNLWPLGVATPPPPTNGNGYQHLPNLPTRNTRTASAAVLSPSTTPRTARATLKSTGLEEWQHQAIHHHDICGELAYVTGFEARSASKATLYAAKLSDDPTIEPARVNDVDHPAYKAVAEFMGGPVGQAQALSTISQQWTIIGISYLVAWDDNNSPSGKVWHVLSPREVTYRKGLWTFTVNGDTVVKTDQGPGSAWVLRIWNPHPFSQWEPTSPTRPLLPVLNELEALTKHVAATIDSRLTGAGLLLLPNEIDFPYDPDDLQEGENPVVHVLVTTAQNALQDHEHASARVPVVMQTPGEYVDKANLIQFATDLDSMTVELRKELIRRMALGLDIPPEILLGLGSSTQWAAWQVEEATIKLHTEPRLQSFCTAFTTGWMRPQLKAKGLPDWDQYVFGFDTTNLKLRPNRAADAKNLHDDLLITDEARRRSSGFSEDEAPDPSEFRRQLLNKIVTDSPQVSLNLLPLLGIDPVIVPGTDADASPVGNPTTPNTDDPDSGTPDEGTQPGNQEPRGPSEG
jgi:hypothetical protein